MTSELRGGPPSVPPIELIDGENLVDMFEQLELGLKPAKAYEIDESFFNEFRD